MDAQASEEAKYTGQYSIFRLISFGWARPNRKSVVVKEPILSKKVFEIVFGEGTLFLGRRGQYFHCRTKRCCRLFHLIWNRSFVLEVHFEEFKLVILGLCYLSAVSWLVQRLDVDIRFSRFRLVKEQFEDCRAILIDGLEEGDPTLEIHESHAC